ncbi:MAG: carboxypeptidase-like regulatory domain-containing protein [Planctomycetota bacterium]|jgi:hypothetical protein
MQKRVLLVLGVLGAASGIVLLLALLLMEPPRPALEETVAPPASLPPPPEDELKAVKHGGTLRGKVIHGLTGEPIAKAKVIALYPHLEPATPGTAAKWGDLRAKFHVYTDPQGTFAVTDLPPDYWNLWVEKRGYSWTTVPRAKFDQEHTIKLYPACSVSGKVVYPDGTPAAGCRIEYHVQGTHSEVFSHYRLEYYYAQTREDGTFAYTDLPPGKFTIEVYPADHLPAPWRYEPPLAPGENRDLGVHKLDGGFSMTVHVRWRGTEQGVPGVEVVVKPVGDPMPRTRIGQRRRTDADGAARFRGLGGQVLEKPRFLVAANLEGGDVILPDEGGMHDPGDEITIWLRKEGVITGKVLRPNGRPLEHFGVQLEPLGHIARQLQVFGENGTFKLYQVPEGNYLLRVRFGNYIDAHLEVEAIGGQEVDVGSITLREGAEIYGTVRRSDGSELEGVVKVHLGRKVKSRSGQEVFEIVGRSYALKDGTYRIKGVPVGSFWLWPESVKDPSGVTDPVPIEVARGVGGVQRDLVIHGEGFLELKFMDEVDGKVTHVVPPPTYLIETATGKEIRWFGAGTRLQGGRYEVAVELKDAAGVPHRYKVREVAVQEGKTTGPIEVRLFEIRNGG